MSKKILKDFVLTEISAVDRPAQPTAKAAIMKRHSPIGESVVKNYYGNSEINAKESQSFIDTVKIQESQRKLWEAKDKIYPLFDALNTSIAAVVADMSTSDADKKSKIATNVTEFYNAVVAEIPDLELELSKFLLNAGSSGINKPDGENMSETELEKKVADLTAEKSSLTAMLEVVSKVAEMSDSEKEVYKAMSDEEKASWLKLTADEKKKKTAEMAKRDETVVVDGKPVSKNAVGDEVFALMKRQSDLEALVAKSVDEVETVRLEKRATEEFKHLAGTPTEIASVLKALKDAPAEVVKSVEGWMRTVNDHGAAASTKVGVAVVSKSVETRDTKVAEIMKRDNVSKLAAMDKVAIEHPELFVEGK